MLRKMLESRVGKMSDKQFIRVMQNTTDDIKFNRIRFKKMTYLEDVLEIAEQCFIVDQRIEKGSSKSHPTQPHYIKDKWGNAIKIKEIILADKGFENTRAI